MIGTLPVAVLIPAWNGWDDTRAALEALARSDPAPGRVLVVDNGSTDGTPGAIARFFPGVEVIELPANLGFAPAVNIGLEHLLQPPAPEAILLLNNDTLPEPAALGLLWESLQQHPSAAGVCPLLPFVRPFDRVWYAGGRVALWRGYVGHRHLRRPVAAVPAGVGETGYLTGAAVLLRVSVLRTIGLLAPEFPFYGEDVDWSLRARRAGWRLLVDTRARIAHRVSASIGGPFSLRKIRARAVALGRLLRLHAPPWQWLTLLPAGVFLTLPQTAAGLLRGAGHRPTSP